MTNLVAIVKSLVGQVFAVSLDGLKRQLFEGDRLLQGEQVLTGLGAEATLQLANGDVINVAQNSNWQAAQTSNPDDEREAESELEQALAAGFDPTTDLEAPAAGQGTNGGTAGPAGDGHSAVLLDETGQRLDPTVGFETQGLGFAGQSLIEQTGGPDVVTAAGVTPIAERSTTIASVTDGVNASGLSPAEGETAIFTVNLSNASSSITELDLALTDGTAKLSTDYSSSLSFNNGVTFNATTGKVTVPAGVTNFTIGVPVIDDSIYEASEAFTLTIDGISASATVVDNDPAPTVSSITSPTAGEGTSLVYDITLSNASSTATTLAFNLGGGSASATDYGIPTFSDGVTLVGGNLVVPAGVTSFSITIPTTDDTLNESTESVPLTLGGVTGIGSISDNDAAPSLSINSISVNEAAGTATFTVTLSAASGQAVSVDYASSNGSAEASSDYTTVNGTLNFAAGELTQTITVPISDDGLVEVSENFTITLSNPSNATLGIASGTATINDNDSAPTVSSIVMADTALSVGETSLVTITFSEAVAAFDNTDVTVENGTLSTLSSTDGGVTWTGTFTPSVNVEDTSNLISVAATYTDTAGNAGTGASSTNYQIDTQAPVLSISDNVAGVANGPVTFTFSFSEAVTGFSADDVAVTNGTKGTFTSVDGQTYTLVVTPTGGEIAVAVAADAAQDEAGNASTAANATQTDANSPPSITVTANNFTEDSGVAVGDVAATYVTNDAEGDAVTVTFNTSSSHYALSGGTVVLTQDGVDVINAGGVLDSIDLVVTQNDDITQIGTGSATPLVTPAADTPTLSITGNSIVATTDFELSDGIPGGKSFSKTVLASSISNGLGSTWQTDNSDGQIEIGMESVYIGGSETNLVIELERNAGDASNLYTYVTAEAGSTYSLDFDYSARSTALTNSNSDIYVYWDGELIATLSASSVGFTSYHFDIPVTADGTYKLEFIAANSNSNGGLLDNITLTEVNDTGSEDSWIRLSEISATLNDTDGSETLSITIDSLPAGSFLKDNSGNLFEATGSNTADITDWDLSTLSFLPPPNYNGTLTLNVTATATETATNDQSSTSSTLNVTVIPLTETEVNGTDANDILIGDSDDNLIMGFAGNDSLTGGGGNDTFIWLDGHTGNDTISDFDVSSDLAEIDSIDLQDLLQGEDSTNIDNYLQVVSTSTETTLQISINGDFNTGGSADLTITLEDGGAPVDLSSFGTTSSQIVSSLIAGADPIIKVDLT